MDVAYLLVKFRKESGLTIDELAEKSGVPKGTINKIIAGTTRAPRVETLNALAQAMGRTLSDFDPAQEAPQPTRPQTVGLSREETVHLIKYRALDARGRKAVDCLLAYEYSCVKPALTLAAHGEGATLQEQEDAVAKLLAAHPELDA